jgi:hypothetical protein
VFCNAPIPTRRSRAAADRNEYACSRGSPCACSPPEAAESFTDGCSLGVGSEIERAALTGVVVVHGFMFGLGVVAVMSLLHLGRLLHLLSCSLGVVLLMGRGTPVVAGAGLLLRRTKAVSFLAALMLLMSVVQTGAVMVFVSGQGSGCCLVCSSAGCPGACCSTQDKRARKEGVMDIDSGLPPPQAQEGTAPPGSYCPESTPRAPSGPLPPLLPARTQGPGPGPVYTRAALGLARSAPPGAAAHTGTAGPALPRLSRRAPLRPRGPDPSRCPLGCRHGVNRPGDCARPAASPRARPR